jgi:hypothetical protein
MASENKAAGKMKWIQLGGLFLLLVVLPIGSWYYLQRGLDYRLEARAELQPLADLPAFELLNYDSQSIASDAFQDYLLIGHFYSGAPTEAYLQVLNKLYDQYDERKDVFFFNFTPDSIQAVSTEQLKNAGLRDSSQIYFVNGDRVSELLSAIKPPLAERGMELSDNSLLFFSDSSVVKGYYDFSQAEELKKLVKHITLNLHPVEEKDIIFEREREK